MQALRAVSPTEPIDGFAIIALWRQWLRGRGLAESTIRLYSYGVFRLLTEHVGASPAQATEEDVTAFLGSLGRRSTARFQYARALRSFFRFATKRGYVLVDPTEDVLVRKNPRKPPVALTEDELVRYIFAAWNRGGPRRAWTLVLCFGAGLRRMEAATIRPEDIQGDVLHIRHAKYGKERRIELSDFARVALEELRPWYNGTVLGGLRRQTLTEWAHQAAVDSGLYPKTRGRVAHVLRASFATALLRNGVPVEVVRDLMGHESIMTTNVYAAVEPEERRAGVQKLWRPIGGRV